MKPRRNVGDYTMTYVNAMQKRKKIGVVRLHKLIADYGELEFWECSYLEHPNIIKQILIKKKKNQILVYFKVKL